MNRLTVRSMLTALALGFALAVATIACSGGGDDDDNDTPAESTAAARTASATGAASTPGANGTAGPGASPGAQTPSSAGNTPGAGGTDGTPAPSDPSNPSAGFEATIAAEAGGDIAGGDPSQPQQPVGDVPTPPPGANIDDEDEVAPPDPPQAGMQVIVDMDATTAGIQSTRNVNVGDVIRVAIVGANLPTEGIAAFNFNLDYDKTKIVAPSYTGGSSTDRNPDFNNEALGDGWTCLPAPEGDIDDPGGISGDGNPATGRALLSCFIVGSGGGGTVVLATVEFRVVAAGSSPLTLNTVAIVDSSAIQIARCEQDPQAGAAAAIPCTPASITIQ